jgi:hypothetical protein
MVEQESHGVREDLAQQPTHEVPQIARPHPLYGVASHELRKNGVYPVAKATQEGARFGMPIPLLGGVWGQKLYAHRRHQLFFGLGRMVVAIPDEQTGGALGELGDN